MNLVAERAGYVLNRDLAELEGCFVDRGDELCQVINPSQKELLASVGESDLIAYRKAAKSGTPVAVRLKGGTSFSVTPTALQLRARLRLPHPTPRWLLLQEDRYLLRSCLMIGLMFRLYSLSYRGIQMDQCSSSLSRDCQIGRMTISDNRSLFERLLTHLNR